jgi:crotonobetainyl-CoA:carnitine CoA-transferase CaiB-like acyl-CoA transferase
LLAESGLAPRGAWAPVDAPEHPVAGRMPIPSYPSRYASVALWLRTPAPTLGRDNALVLSGVLGLSEEELRALEADGVIGTRPEGL